MEDGWIVQPSLQCSKLHGREDELNIIHDAIERCLSSSGEALKVDAANTASVQNGKRPKMQRRKSFIFVDGVSGVGKSSLVEEDVLLRRFTTKQESNPPLCMYGYGKFEAKKIATPFAAIGKMLADIAAKLVHPINEGMKCHHSDYYVHRQILKSLNDKFDRFDKETLSNLDSRLGDIFSLGNQHLFDIDSEDGTTSTLSHSQSIRSTAGNGSGAFSVLSEASVGNDELLITMSTGLEELKNLLRIFIRTVAVTAPVVLVADDLQWMDEPSFQILKYIIEDHETVNLVFIGLYRPGQSLPEFTTEWMEGLSSDNNIDVTHIHLQTLSLSSIEELLSDAMRLEMEDVQKLAILVHDRTDGNPFYLTQLLESLQARGLLRYECNGSDFRWIWDEREIKESTMMVADEATMKIVVDRLRQLPERVQSCLHGAACIGSRFETRFLRTVMSATSAKGIEISSSFEQDLNVATQRKLVEETSQPGIHRFTHDQVYETALNLRAASPAERQDWHLKIGRALAKEFGVTDAVHDLELGKIEDSVLFVCTDQLNLGNELLLKSIEDSLSTKEYEEEAILLCQLNLEAGTRCATSMNAYTSSKEYLELGLRYIKKVHADPWEDNPNLMLEFHTALAEVYLCCGEPERVPSLVHETLLQTSKVPQLDTFRIRYAHLQALHTINNIDLLVDESLVLLDELGETFHKETTEKIVSNKRKAILKRLDALKDEDILCLGSLKDRRRIRAIQILVHVLSNVQYFSRYQGLTKVSQLRLLEMTLDYGICKFSAKGLVFASYALFDESKKILFDAFMRVANLAIKIAKKYGKTDWRNNITADGLVFRHWREPYAANVNDSLFQYENFLKHGNIDAAFHVRLYMIVPLYIYIYIYILFVRLFVIALAVFILTWFSSSFFYLILYILYLSKQAVALYVYTYYFSGLDIRPLLKDMEAMCAVQWQYG